MESQWVMLFTINFAQITVSLLTVFTVLFIHRLWSFMGEENLQYLLYTDIKDLQFFFFKLRHLINCDMLDMSQQYFLYTN